MDNTDYANYVNSTEEVIFTIRSRNNFIVIEPHALNVGELQFAASDALYRVFWNYDYQTDRFTLWAEILDQNVSTLAYVDYVDNRIIMAENPVLNQNLQVEIIGAENIPAILNKDK